MYGNVNSLSANLHKMVKHTQTIHCLLPMGCLSVFDHFVRLALERLIASFTGGLDCVCQQTCFRCFAVFKILIVGSYFIQYLVR